MSLHVIVVIQWVFFNASYLTMLSNDMCLSLMKNKNSLFAKFIQSYTVSLPFLNVLETFTSQQMSLISLTYTQNSISLGVFVANHKGVTMF